MRATRVALAPLAGLGLLLGGVAACLPAPEDPFFEPMCETTDDCNSGAGEICDQGVCWGDPPPVPLAAHISPPPELYGYLVANEVPELVIDQSGTMATLQFETPELLIGRVLIECPDDAGQDCVPGVSVAARVDIERPPRITGGPAYDPQPVLAAPDLSDGEIAFAIPVPASLPGELYRVTIIPDDGSTSGILYEGRSPAELAPPERFYVEVTPGSGAIDISREIGQVAQLKTIVGRIENAVGQGLAGISVKAEAATEGGRVERVSTKAITDEDGAFSLRVPIDLAKADLVATPSDLTTAPVLRIHDVDVSLDDGTNVVELETFRAPPHASPVVFNLKVQGTVGNGTLGGVAAADVELTTTLSNPDASVVATFTARATSDGAGEVEIALIPAFADANRTYRMRVTPQPNTSYGAVFDQELSIGPAGGWLPEVVLPQRVRVSGRLFRDTGEPLEGASVTAHTSTSFYWGLELMTQEALTGIDLPTSLVAADGSFVLWLDPLIADELTYYDLEVNPPSGAALPRWTIPDVGVDPDARALEGVELGGKIQPAPSFARGAILGPDGFPLAGASITVYELPTDYSICAAYGGDECAPPAIPRGTWTADENGEVRCVLPRSPE
jgi:hypothetical protein